MSLLIDDKDRQIIPRWRDSATTAALGELDSLQPAEERDLPQDLLVEEKAADWTEHRSVSFASDLLATAISTGAKHPAASEAADFLIASPSASMPAKAVARRFLGHFQSAGDLLERYSSVETALKPETHHERIRALKRTLRDSPRNALARADLALQYTKLGLLEQSLSAMEVALRLSPENRLLLRSAARLLVHVGDSDGALAVLRQSERGKSDPWLAAAEVAIAGLAKRPPRFAKIGQQILNSDRFSPFQTSELASALATAENTAGAHKNARRLFNRSLVDPTENALAQATWAAQRLDISDLQPRIDVPGSFEARALSERRAGNFANALQATWRWLGDQTFSKTAAIFGSYLASVALDDYETALRFVQAGQTANPNDWLLMNNYAFSLASLGRVDDAERVLDAIPVNLADSDRTATLLATKGLILYRQGLVSAGFDFYSKARELFKENRNQKAAALATTLHAREEVLANGNQAEALTRRAQEMAAAVDSVEVATAAERVQRMLRERRPAALADPASR